MKENLLEILKKLSKTGNFKILIALNDGSKRWSQLEKLADKKTLSKSINELFDLGLIEATIIHDTPTGSKAYQLSPLGKKVVQLLEQIEKEFEEYHSHLPKEPEKFVNELIEGE
ncbi:transcriptional regulator, HxlR family [Archaeoglobus sulfaticallidus PM70-1]|uniref:Transcriptional regulator, HxlR family n=1 Tax=Archaeoglobus sulfaticallidus PM70-1 TaxID=387631 RepID=N0BD88_9EURY|nr:winged helix-turn-helix transcriptional regulator [Archaeoglobus sulfaticallidus]AGK60968.1 transcriptional regulator, HxlR family [Archaeoglobus sulfaticallidus PM70-1]